MEKYKDFYIPAAIVIAGIIIAGSIMYVSSGGNLTSLLPKSQAPEATEKSSTKLEVKVTAQDHIRGNLSAPVTIVEFSDLECPFCKSFHPTVKRALAEYGAQVRWVYKHFPLDSLHPKADKEAEATECANELGGNEKFWEYVDRIFEITPSNNGLDSSLLPQIAQDIGLDRAKFEQCLSSGKYAQHVEEDYQKGISLGIEGTPGSFVNGVPVAGAVPYEILKAIIEEELKKL